MDVSSVIGIVFGPEARSVLLVFRRDVPVWVLPGGGLEINESPEEAITREILEETGLSVKVERVVGRYKALNKLAKNTILFECSVLSGSLRTSSETKKVEFFPVEKLPKMPPPFLDWINDSLEFSPPKEKEITSINIYSILYFCFRNPIKVIRFLLSRLGWHINSKS